MNAVLALLLGLVCITVNSDDDGEAFSWDSDDSDATRSYDGLVVQVYNPTEGEPVITLGTDLDDHESTYCLTLIRTFEATGYDLESSTSSHSDYEEVSGSFVDLSNADCEVSETSDTTFSITCNDVRGATLTFAFTFISNTQGDEGLEYTITLEEYTFIQDDAQLVLVQSVQECSDTYAYSADSGDDSVDIDDTEDDDDLDDNNDLGGDRRRLQMDSVDTEGDDTENDDDDTEDTEVSVDDDTDSDSTDVSEDGISEDDSNEFDAGYTQYIVNGQAYDDCNGERTAIGSNLVYDDDDEELHIVFAHFDCTLFIDPYFGVDNTKLESGASGYYVTIASIIGFIGAFLF
eukprot:CAMPEP_0201566026 /NCGR_PEP_ID=MMETSP0190_2-20130828/5526_1 /ASSEMBLY_ACC=CAM_ASM_000263 /TAXON_ID=37353 /ORGANISM="Rosalina sp." /LENGTH=346 /DNA_ID=CAMNT_0047984199 /DNA_START=66 /DNA_END=1106 /DNA_ORIENTATION=+